MFDALFEYPVYPIGTILLFIFSMTVLMVATSFLVWGFYSKKKRN